MHSQVVKKKKRQGNGYAKSKDNGLEQPQEKGKIWRRKDIPKRKNRRVTET